MKKVTTPVHTDVCIQCLDSVISSLQGIYTTDGHDTEEVETALKNGCIAIVAEAGNDLGVDVPDTVPVIWCEDVDELSARLAAVYYGEQLACICLMCVVERASFENSLQQPLYSSVTQGAHIVTRHIDCWDSRRAVVAKHVLTQPTRSSWCSWHFTSLLRISLILTLHTVVLLLLLLSLSCRLPQCSNEHRSCHRHQRQNHSIMAYPGCA
jgi:hypothetical protein